VAVAAVVVVLDTGEIMCIVSQSICRFTHMAALGFHNPSLAPFKTMIGHSIAGGYPP
jgi:hypothetical protein